MAKTREKLQKAEAVFNAKNLGLTLTSADQQALWASLDKHWNLRNIFTTSEYNQLKQKLQLKKIEDQKALEKALKGDKIALSNLVLDHANLASLNAKAELDTALEGTIERLAQIARDKRTEQAKKTGEKPKASSFPATLEQQQHYNGEQTVMLYAIKSLAFILGATPMMDLISAGFDARAAGHTNWLETWFSEAQNRINNRLEEFTGRPGEGQEKEDDYGAAAAVNAANAPQQLAPSRQAPAVRVGVGV